MGCGRLSEMGGVVCLRWGVGVCVRLGGVVCLRWGVGVCVIWVVVVYLQLGYGLDNYFRLRVICIRCIWDGISCL